MSKTKLKTPTNKEIRTIQGAEIRMTEGEDSRTIEGYGIVFNSESRTLGGWFVEVIKPEAVTRALESNKDIFVAINHDYSKLIGRGKAGNVRFTVDEKGVKYSVDVPNTSYGEDLLENVRAKLFQGSSFIFEMSRNEDAEKWEKETRDGKIVWKRTISDISVIHEMGPVIGEAYEDTTVAKRNFDAANEEKPPVIEESNDFDFDEEIYKHRLG